MLLDRVKGVGAIETMYTRSGLGIISKILYGLIGMSLINIMTLSIRAMKISLLKNYHLTMEFDYNIHLYLFFSYSVIFIFIYIINYLYKLN